MSERRRSYDRSNSGYQYLAVHFDGAQADITGLNDFDNIHIHNDMNGEPNNLTSERERFVNDQHGDSDDQIYNDRDTLLQNFPGN